MLYLYYMFVGAARDDALPDIMNPRKPTEQLPEKRLVEIGDILRAGFEDMAKECEEYLVSRGLMTRDMRIPPGNAMVRSTSIPHSDQNPPPAPSVVATIQP